MPPNTDTKTVTNADAAVEWWQVSKDHRTVSFVNRTSNFIELTSLQTPGRTQTLTERVVVRPGDTYHWRFLGEYIAGGKLSI